MYAVVKITLCSKLEVAAPDTLALFAVVAEPTEPPAVRTEVQDKFPEVSDCNTDVPDPGYAVGKVYKVVAAKEAEDLNPTKYLPSVELNIFKVCPIEALPETPMPPLDCIEPVNKDVELFVL